MRRILSRIFLITGVALLCQGFYIPAKAQLAQVLIADAFQTPGEKPWPWADMMPVAKLRVERLGVEQVLLSDASGRSMAFGAGKMRENVFAGHRDTNFSFLAELEAGDEIELEDQAHNIEKYRVRGGIVVHESDGSWLHALGDKELALLTCWPFQALNPGTEWRYVVVAEP